MKANYDKKAEQIEEFKEDLQNIVKSAKNEKSVNKVTYTNEHIFGENFVEAVRNKILADYFILPDEMIQADLHIQVARKQVENFTESNKYIGNEEKVREIALNYLSASVCHALSSRVKEIAYKDYAGYNYHNKYVGFLFKANNEKVKLMSELGLM